MNLGLKLHLKLNFINEIIKFDSFVNAIMTTIFLNVHQICYVVYTREKTIQIHKSEK